VSSDCTDRDLLDSVDLESGKEAPKHLCSRHRAIAAPSASQDKPSAGRAPEAVKLSCDSILADDDGVDRDRGFVFAVLEPLISVGIHRDSPLFVLIDHEGSNTDV
jgi:hypothetical protein